MKWNDFLFCVGTMTLTGSLAYIAMICLHRLVDRLDVRYRKLLMKIVIMLFVVPVLYPVMLTSRYGYVNGEWVHRGEFGLRIPTPMQEIFVILGILWSVGLLVGVILRICQYVGFRRILRCSHPADNRYWEWELLAAKEQYGIKELSIYENELIGSPLIAGVFRPKLIVPTREFTETEMRMMMKHELYHVYSKDLLWKKMGLWMMWLHWFNPLVYRVMKQFMLEQERVCDLMVCEENEGYTPRDYCELLYELEPGEYGSVFSAALYESKSELERRIKALKERKGYLRYKKWVAAVSCLALGLLSCIPAYGMSEVMAKQEEEWREQYVVATEIAPYVTEGILQNVDDGTVREVFVDNTVTTYAITVQIELTAVANTRYLYSDRELEAGDCITMTIATADPIAPFKIGIKNMDTGELMYISGSEVLVGTFTAPKAGTYCAYIENNASYQVTFEGVIIYPN